MSDGTTILLENFNAIYLGKDMEDSLVNPIQCEDSNVRVDMRPKYFYPGQESECQRLLFEDGTSLPLEFDGVLPYLKVRRPNEHELHNCTRLQLTSDNEWDPNKFNGIISNVNRNDQVKNNMLEDDSMQASLLAALPLLHEKNDSYYSIQAIRTSNKPTLTPEQLSKMWKIGLKTASRTLQATTHKCIRSTGLMSRRFKTDKSQLRYRQLKRQFGTFYVDYLKVSTKSIRGNIGGSLYTNKLGFKKFFPHSDETGESTAHGLRTFLDIVGLPYSIHADNHGNYRDGPFKRLLRKFGILKPLLNRTPHGKIGLNTPLGR